jgi:predicted nucleotidyltransferase
MPERTFSEDTVEAMADLCRRFGVIELDLFGSAAKGAFSPDSSDIDLLVRFADLPPSDYADAYFGLQAALAELLGCPIDLVTEASLANPYFRQRIQAERQPIFRAAA